MHIGLAAFATDEAIAPHELAVAAEERGFESLLFTEHTHIPSSRRTPFPGGDLPRQYARTFDPFVAVAAATPATRTLRLGTGICLVTQHHPITLAKLVASADHLSGGRFLFGVGAGWNAEEMRNHGTDPAKRWTVTRERIEAMQAVWTHDEAEYHGATVDFDPIWSWPKPVQKPWPPILVGGAGSAALDRVFDYGDEWMPLYGAVRKTIADDIVELRRRASERACPAPAVTVYWPPADETELLRLAHCGVHRVVLAAPPAPADVVVPVLDSWAPLVERMAGVEASGGQG